MRDCEAVLRFWFGELKPKQWFTRDERLDRLIRERFLSTYEEAKRVDPQSLAQAREALAHVIALDQFPRNMFRGTPQAFATDDLALAISRHAIASGLDKQLDRFGRIFLYMPFQHSEDRDVQASSVELFASVGDDNSLDYARQHREIIERFGRFPHRNAVLGRASSAEELEFLKTHKGF
ncbi:MAG TPA: DUF924 family protein [Steroidobacter sp.]